MVKAPRRKVLEQPLPAHGILYFDHLHAEYRSKPLETVKPETQAVIDDLLEKRKQDTLTWNDLYTFELILSRLLRPESLAREVWSLRLRYRDVAGLREYEAYLASKPPDPAGQVEEKALRADIEYLTGEIYLRYAMTPVNQMVSDSISKRVTGIILVGVVIIVLSVILRESIQPLKNSLTLLNVLFVGAMGGLLSMQQRYQSVSREGDQIDNVSELLQGWPRLFLPVISGGLFATLLYMLIIGGLLEGDLFPKLTHTSMLNGVKFWDLLDYGIPISSSDYAKLIVWSFLAGFAERFVPDTLSGFISKRETESRSGS
jgi:hypothetical protein